MANLLGLRTVIPVARDGWRRLLFWRKYFLYADTVNNMADVELERHLGRRIHFVADLIKRGSAYKLCLVWVRRKHEDAFTRAIGEYEKRIAPYYPEVINGLQDCALLEM